jgi:Domain of unknown function (DUF929).
MGKSKKGTRESRLVYVPFIIAVVIIALVLVLPSVKSPATNTTQNGGSFPFLQFVKVSNQDYASSPDTVEVYFVSWEGCTYGAAQSWPIYLALSHYGKVNATPNWSDPEPLLTPNGSVSAPMQVPGLLFQSFEPNGSVRFHSFYMIGRIFYNGTFSLTNGTVIPYSGDSIVTLEQEELQKDVPGWVYDLIVKYELETPVGQYPDLAEAGNPPHLATVLLITGPNGTWMIIGYDKNVNPVAPYFLAASGYTPQELYGYVSKGVLPNVTATSSPQGYFQQEATLYIQQEAQQILNVIREAE